MKKLLTIITFFLLAFGLIGCSQNDEKTEVKGDGDVSITEDNVLADKDEDEKVEDEKVEDKDEDEKVEDEKVEDKDEDEKLEDEKKDDKLDDENDIIDEDDKDDDEEEIVLQDEQVKEIKINDITTKFYEDLKSESYGIEKVDIFYDLKQNTSDLKMVVEFQDNKGNFLNEKRITICSYCNEGKKNVEVPINLRSNDPGKMKIVVKIYKDTTLILNKTFTKVLGGYTGEINKKVDVSLLEYELNAGGLDLKVSKKSEVDIEGKFRIKNVGNIPLLLKVHREIIVDGNLDGQVDGSPFNLLIVEPNNVLIADLGFRGSNSDNKWSMETLKKGAAIKIQVTDVNSDEMIFEKEFPKSIGCKDSSTSQNYCEQVDY